MLDSFALKTIGRRLRAENTNRPKGGIPRPIWTLLLALEQAELKAGRSDTGRAG
ncbi:MAG: hypothetical protein JWR08_678 [Enterovirga sp.]|jgi:hypothetical protein|nr:hypothetical protein [Enterovirga sp.]